MGKITLMIAEDHRIFREALAQRIAEASSTIEIIGLAENGSVLLQAFKRAVPDVILLDMNMPEMNGWKVLDFLKTEYPSVKTVVLSGEFDNAHVTHALLAGARAYIDKWRASEFDIIQAISEVCENGYYFNDIVSQEIIISIKKSKSIQPIEEEQVFSQREQEVIQQICEGKQVKEIAASLNISNGAVKFHKSNVFKKTESNTNVDLLRYAIRYGIYNVFDVDDKKKG